MMTIIAKTQSGTEYRFYEKDGHTFFRRGYMTVGVVDRVKNGPIQVGKPIEMDFYKEGLYGKLESGIMFCNTTPVTEIKVVL